MPQSFSKFLLYTAVTCAIPLIAVSAPRPCLAIGPEPLLLWPDGAPDAQGDDDGDNPALWVHLPPPERATGAGVVICPGGGYGVLAVDHEGHQIAKWFNSIGVAGFVLRYRLGPKYHHPAPLDDVQRAIRFVRAKTKEFNVSPQRVGVMGFSAGGHLASTAATHFDDGNADSDDPIQRLSCRPDFAILGYPVISMTEDFGHRGSRRNLLGEDFDPKLAELLSNEKQVTAETPPTFLFHTGEDRGVPVENSLAFYAALVKAGVPGELHVYQNGPHGVGLAPGDPVIFTWKERLADWLKTNGWLADVERAPVSGTITRGGEPLRWGQITFLPLDNDNAPAAFAPISRGRYSIPTQRGVVTGANRVVILDMGDVVPHPTIDDVQNVGGDELRVDVNAGDNVFDFNLN